MIRPAPRPLVRDPRRARRRDAGARGAGDDGRGRARGAASRGAAGGARRPAPAARRVRRAVAALSRVLARATAARASAVSRGADGDAARSLAHLRAWAEDAEPVIQQLQRGEAERAELLLWRRVLATLGASAIDFARLARRRPGAARAPVRVPAGQRARAAAGHARAQRRSRRDAWSARSPRWRSAPPTTSRRSRSRRRCSRAASTTCRPGCAPTPRETERYIAPRLAALDREEARLATELAALHAQHDLADRAGRCAPPAVGASRTCARSRPATCSAGSPAGPATSAATRLGAALERSGARALLHFPPPPPKARAPLLLRNPLWARPFEIFSRALGMPSRNEADPSVAARDRGAADVRLHVRRRRPGPGDRRRRLRAAQALSDRAPARSSAGSSPPCSACCSAACSACTRSLPRCGCTRSTSR